MLQRLLGSMLPPTEPRSPQPGVGRRRVGLQWVGRHRVGLHWVGLHWVGLHWVGLHWVGLHWLGEYGAAADRASANRSELGGRRSVAAVRTRRLVAALAAVATFAAILAGCDSAENATEAVGASDAVDASPLAETDAGVDTAPVVRCNGRADLCDRRLNEVALASTHNAMSVADWQFFLPNQPHSLIDQLDAGIRGMLLDVHLPGDNVSDVPADRAQLCHADCVLGRRDLATELVAIGVWLDAHPQEVLVWVLEDSAPMASIHAALVEADFVRRCATPTKGQPLPTLAELTAAGTQVFVMLESGREDYPWAHSYAGWGQDNPYSAEKVEDFSCVRLRGAAGNPLLNINHFLTTNDLTSREKLSTVANAKEVLFAHVLQCQEAFGQLPNLVSVDWYTTGALLELVDALNDGFGQQ